MTKDMPRSELGSVIAGVDGSPFAKRAALWAAAEADRRGRPLHLVHAADTDRRAVFATAGTLQAVRETGRDLLIEIADVVQERFPDLSVTRELSRLEPVAGLQAAAGQHGTIVVGNRGYGGFAALLLGSVSLGVAAQAKVPVVVVRGESDRPATGSVTAAVNGASDIGWLPLAAAEAEARIASLRLVSVWSMLTGVGHITTVTDGLERIVQQREHEVQTLADHLREAYPYLIIESEVETGISTPGILVEASARTDLLVMGSEHPALGMGPSLGRVAHSLLHHAHCPVQIVPLAFVAPDGER